MAYTEISKRASEKYRKEKQHRIPLDYKNEEYEQVIKPAIDKSGKPVATYVKEAVSEKIKREFVQNGYVKQSFTFAHICYTDADFCPRKIVYILNSDNLEKTKEMFKEELQQNLPQMLPGCTITRVQVDKPVVALFSRE